MNLLLTIGLAAFALLAWKDHRKAFFLFVGLLPTYVIRFTALGLPTTALEVMFWILFAAWMLKREKRLVDIRSWRLLLLAWVTAATVAVFVSPDTRAAAGVWKAYFVEPVLFFIVASDVLRAAEDRAKAIAALAWCAVGVGLVAIFQKFTGAAVPDPWNRPGEFRATALYGFPNAIGLFLAPLVPLFASLALTARAHRRRLALFAAAAGLSAAAIVLAQSEGAMIGAAAGLVLLGLLNVKIRKPLVAGLAVAAIIIIAIPAARNLAIEKLTLKDWSGRVRTEMWAETWNMMRDRPLLGAGLSGYPIAFKPYHKAGHIEIFQYPHQILLNFWSELGLPGLVLLGWTIYLVLKSKNRLLTAAFAALLVHGLVDVPYFKNDLAFLWWLLLALVASRQAEARQAARKT